MLNLEHIILAFSNVNVASVNVVIDNHKFKHSGLHLECLITKPTPLGVTGFFSVKEKQSDGNLHIKIAYKLVYQRLNDTENPELYSITIDNTRTDLEYLQKTSRLGFEVIAEEQFKTILSHLADPENYQEFIKQAELSSHKTLKDDVISF